MPDTDATGVLAVDDPAVGVRRLTLDRPTKRNALSHRLRSELFTHLRAANADPAITVVVIAANGPDFCAGYDLRQDPSELLPWAIPPGLSGWAKHVAQGWFEMWDLDVAVIAQVHGRCLAGGTELVAACDLVYVADDAAIGYPAVRTMAPPDFAWQPALLGMRAAMEALLTGDTMSGIDAVRTGLANRAVPAAALEATVLEVAQRVARVPGELTAHNKRVVHQAMEAAGIRTGIRANVDLHGRARSTAASRAGFARIGAGALTEALTERDQAFGDGRTRARSGDE